MNSASAFLHQPGGRFITDQNSFPHSLSTHRSNSFSLIARRAPPTLLLSNGDKEGVNQPLDNEDGSDNNDSNNLSDNTPPFNTRRDSDLRLPALARRLSITRILLTLNVLIFILQLYFGDGMKIMFMQENAAVASGEWYRLITSMFLHNNFTHLLNNCLVLQCAGPSVEGWLGKGRYIVLYFFSGLFGNFTSFLATTRPSVGASGAILGVVSSLSVFRLRRRDIIGSMTLILVLVVQLLPPVDLFTDGPAHIGGVLGGLVFVYIAGPRLRRVRSVLIDRPLYMVVTSKIWHKWKLMVRRFL